MVASLEQKTQSACGFVFLKPIAPNPKPKPRRKVGRWLGAACGFANACVVGAAIFLSGLPKPVVIAQPVPAEATLYGVVATPEYLAWEEQYQREERSRLLAEAEATKKAADNIKLVASYKLADTVLPYAPGEDIKTTTLVDVTCTQDEFGWVAMVRQVEGKYQNGDIGHLESCNAGRHQPGEAIARAGRYQASLRNSP